MALRINGIVVFPDHTDAEQDARLAEMIDQCEECGTHSPDIRAFGTERHLLCPACYAKAEYWSARPWGVWDSETGNAVAAFATEEEARAAIDDATDLLIIKDKDAQDQEVTE